MANDKYREIFAQEAEELLEKLEEALLALEDEPSNLDLVAEAFRALHTLKGSGAMAGVDDLAAFAHEVEAVFDLVRTGELPVTSQLVSLSLAAKDHLRMQAEGEASEHTGAQLVAAFKEMSGSAQTGAGAVAPSSAPTSRQTYDLALSFAPDVFSDGTQIAGFFDELRDLGDLTLEVCTDAVPSVAEMDAERLYLSWRGSLTTDATADAVKEVFMFLADDSGISVVPRAEQASSAAGGEGAVEKSGRAKASAATIKVPVPKLDGLVDLVGELVIAKSRLAAISRKVRDPDLLSVAEDVERLTNDLRDRTMGLRMLPIGTTFRRFQRLVRDLSTDLGKDIQLVTQGAETELDKTVLDRLADPLVHLIRNSADHGLESNEEREAAGKPREGTIRLTAEQTEARVVIQVADDGKGLDAEKIRAKAIERELIAPDAELSAQELYALILEPGFSTAAKVSNVSGRGVGMDAVRRSIEDLSGSLDIASTQGSGTTITIRLPLSLAIMEGLLVRIGDDPFVFPLSLIEECVEPPKRTRSEGPESRLTEVRGELVPFIRLREWFEVTGDADEDGQIVIAHLAQGRFGFLVDRVVGQHQTVIKDLGPVGRDVDGLSGATILGDGTVALILDAAKIVDTAQAPTA